MKRTDEYGKRVYKNRISAAIREYREDFEYNRDWWFDTMGAGENNEYLFVKFKNGDTLCVDSFYFWAECTDKFPHFNASDVLYISRYFGDGIETITTCDLVIDTDVIITYCNGEEVMRHDMSDIEFKQMKHIASDSNPETDDVIVLMIEYAKKIINTEL